MTIFNRLVGYLFHFFFSFFRSICCFLTCLFLTFFVLYIIKWSIDQRPNLIYSCFLIHSLFWMFWLAFQLNVACQSTFFSQLTLCALALLHAYCAAHFNRMVQPVPSTSSDVSYFFFLLLLPISAHLNSWGSTTFWGNGLGTLTIDVCESDGLITSPSINQSKEKAWPTLFLFWTNKQQNVQNNTRRL